MKVHRQKNENIENRGKKEKELNFTRQISFCAMLSLSCELITSIVVLCQNYRQFMIRNFIIFTAQRNFALVSDFVQQLPVQETLSTHPVKVLKIIFFLNEILQICCNESESQTTSKQKRALQSSRDELYRDRIQSNCSQ